MKRFKTVDEYIAASGDWQGALNQLRAIVLSTGMRETVKWGSPVYTHQGKNVVGLGSFKSYVGLWFYQGVFLQDKAKKLVNAQEGVTKAMRQWRFGSAGEIEPGLILAYLQEAMRNQEAGKHVKPVKAKQLVIPAELDAALHEDPPFKQSFESLRPGQQREYADYVQAAKRAETRINRLAKIKPMILAGVGLNDKYRSPSN